MDAYWLRYLPHFLRRHVDGRFELQAILGNSSWLTTDKLLRLVVGTPITIWIARYLGPESFGLLSYSIAFVAIFGAFASFGLDRIVVRELVRRPEEASEIIGTSLAIRITTGIVAASAAMLAIRLGDAPDPRTSWLVSIIAAGLIFQSFDVFDSWFQSRVQSKFTIVAKGFAFLLASAFRAYLILAGAGLLAFAAASLTEIVLGAAFLAATYRRRSLVPRPRFRMTQAAHLTREAWPLLLSGLAVTLYMRLDIVMLQEMAAPEQTGAYAAATRLSEVWYALPIALAASAYPALLRSHSTDTRAYLAKIRRMYFVFAWLAIGISLPLSILANPLVELLYGAKFAASGPILAVHLWASVAVFLGISSSQHLLANNLQMISLYRTCIGLGSNFLLNLLLIPSYQGLGAAIATLVSYFVATFSLALFPQARSHARYMLVAPFSR